MGAKGQPLGRSSLILLGLSLLALLGLLARGDWGADNVALAGAQRFIGRPSAFTAGDLPAIPSRPAPRKASSLSRSEPAPFIEPVPELQAQVYREPEERVPDIDLLILDLANDRIVGNARKARQKLVYFLRRQRRGEDQQPVVTAANVNAFNMRAVCKEKLGFALLSRDHQQRQLAANILINCSEGPFPSALSAVLVEALRYDSIDGWTCRANNEADATKYLVNRPTALKECAPLLRSALYSSDGQQRFLAAFILGAGAQPSDIGAVCPLLFEHLKDNGIPGDATMATRSLLRMGGAALPYIDAELLRVADEQARDMLNGAKGTILYYLERPEASPYRGELGVKIFWDAKMSR